MDDLVDDDNRGRAMMQHAMLGANHTGMRARNERLVLSLIRRNGALPKSEIARMTGLSAQTVSVIMRALEEDGLLLKCDPVRGRVGQPSVPMDLAPDGAFFLGLKVGRRRTEMALVDFTGAARGHKVTRHDYPTPDATVEFAIRAAGDLVPALGDELASRVAGMGIGLPYQMWEWAPALHVSRDAMADWRQRDIQAELAEALPWPVLLENDASAACNAELVLGKGDLPENFLYAFIGFYIGGGLVLNGCLHPGPTGNAGALASMPVPDGQGGARQLMRVASLSVLEERLGGEGGHLWEGLENWNIPPDVLETWIGEAAQGLAHAAASASALCDVDALVIDGWLPAGLRDRLAQEVGRAMEGIDMSGIRRPEVRIGTVGPLARSLGAASLPLAERFMLDNGQYY